MPAPVQVPGRPARPVFRACPPRRCHPANHLRPVVGLLRRSDREEAAQPLPARLAGPVVRHGGLQPRPAGSARTGTSRRARVRPLERAGDARGRSPRRPNASGCGRVAFTYNDPVIFLEYALDAAAACRERGVKTVAVTAGFICAEPRNRFFAAWTPPTSTLRASPRASTRSYARARSAPVLDTLKSSHARNRCLDRDHHAADPGRERSAGELEALSDWIAGDLGPTYRCTSPPSTLTGGCGTRRRRRPRRCWRPGASPWRRASLRLHWQHPRRGRQSTWCHGCGARLIGRDWHELTAWNLSASGRCTECGAACAGVFDGEPGRWDADAARCSWAVFRRGVINPFATGLWKPAI